MSAVARSVSIYEAKTHLSQLVAELEQAGGEITVNRHGRPVAKIVPFGQRRAPRTPGAMRGEIHFTQGWDEFTDQDAKDWFGA
jgi:prevent-host-death family protein